MAIDTKDKRINVMNIVCRTFTGITPTGAIDQNDKENYAWLYFPYTYPSQVATGSGIPWHMRDKMNLRRKLFSK